MKTITTLIMIIAFLLGFLSYYGIQHLHVSEKPLGITLIGATTAPIGSIDRSNVIINNDEVIIKIQNASLGRYAATGSMEPTLDENSIGLRIPVTDEDEIRIGDIVTYENDNRELIIHRVVSIGLDEKGIYYLMKGDNNFIIDAKVYFKQLRYKLIGLIY